MSVGRPRMSRSTAPTRFIPDMDNCRRTRAYRRTRARVGRHIPSRLTLFVLTLLPLAGCYDLFGPEEELLIGVVSHYSEPIVIDLPDTVQVGVAFPVRVRTYGGGCERIGPTEVTSQDGGVLVVPRDFTKTGAGVACTDELRWFDHEAEVVLQTPGSATVTIRGRVEPGDGIDDFVRTVVVE